MGSTKGYARLSLNDKKILAKVQNTEMGLYVAQQWYAIQKRYIPRRTGQLMDNVSFRPLKIMFNSHHAGKVYRGVSDGRTIVFRTDRNPLATAYWDRAAAADGQLAVLYRRINRKLRGGI